MSFRKSRYRTIVDLVGGPILRWISISVGASTLLVFIELAVAFLIQGILFAFDLMKVPPQNPLTGQTFQTSIASVSVALLSVGAVRAVAQYLTYISSVKCQESSLARMRGILLGDILGARRKTPPLQTEIQALLTENFTKASRLFVEGVTFVSLAVQCTGLGLLMAVTAWRESIVAFAGLFLIGGAVTLTNRVVRKSGAQVPVELKQLINGIEGVSRNWLLVKLLRTERKERDFLLKNVEAYKFHAERASAYFYLSTSSTPFIGIALIVIILWSSQTIFHSPGAIALTFLYLFVRFVQCASGAVQTYGYIVSIKEQIRNVYMYCVENFYVDDFRDELKFNSQLKISEKFQPPAIQFSGVSYTHPGSKYEIFKDLSLTIKSGEQAGVIGPSGVGKSTMLMLTLGILHPIDGTVTIDGISSRDYIEKYPIKIAYAGVEPFLFQGTVRENISYGSGGRAEAFVDSLYWNALEKAHLSEFVRNLEHGLDYVLDERSSTLSAGQRQRLAIARCFYANPDLMILDEATANLDPESERLIAESLKALRGKTTVLIVSHRPGIIEHADTVLNLSNVKLI